MFLQKIDKWYSGVNKFLFYHKDGFFELPYLSNSPEAIIKSIVKMPFVKHVEEERFFESDTQFAKVAVHYRELEKGLWMICANARYKANVNYRRIIDKDIPADYYMLSLEISASSGKTKPVLINGMTYSKCTWLLFKPKANVVRSHFKNSHTLSYALFFSEKWLKKVLNKDNRFLNSKLKYFFESKAKYIIWPDVSGTLNTVCKPIQNALNDTSNLHIKTLGNLADNLFFRFIETYDTDDSNQSFFEIPDNDRKKV